ASCTLCCQRLDALPDDPLVGLLRGSSAGSRGPSPTLSTGTRQTPAPALSAIPETPPELVNHPRYRIVGVLGGGGMGTVFKAEHRLMERIVALKVIRKEWTAKPEAVERFRMEVKAAARLAHPNIVSAFDADKAGDVHFLIMEYVEGESLERLLKRRGRLPVAEACDYIRQAALGLQHGFERGMVHRDIKPANILLQIEDSESRIEEAKGDSDESAIRNPQAVIAKITDFGLALLASQCPSDATAPMTAV